MKNTLLKHLAVLCILASSRMVITCFPIESLEVIIQREVNTPVKWKKACLQLESTKPSLFNYKEDTHLRLFPIEPSKNGLIAFDCERKILDYLHNKCKLKICEYKTNRSDQKDICFKLSHQLKVFAVAQNQIKLFSGIVSEWWYKPGQNECPGNELFPLVRIVLNDCAILNCGTEDSLIIGFLGAGKKILNRIKKTEIRVTKNKSLKTEGESNIFGTSFDLNGDDIDDIFIFKQQLSEYKSYIRIYANFNGEWVCNWDGLEEECF